MCIEVTTLVLTFFNTCFSDVCRCVGYALKRRHRAESDEFRHHWLDWADDKYSPQLISDIKAVINVLVIFSPLVMFWALFEQQVNVKKYIYDNYAMATHPIISNGEPV